MRISKERGALRVKAIAGTHVVLMALDMDEQARQGLHGFAIKRGQGGQPQQWLKGIKYFKDLVQSPETRRLLFLAGAAVPILPVVRLHREPGHRIRLHHRRAVRRPP